MSRRFLKVFLLAIVVAGVVVSTAAALRFTDESYNPPRGVVGASYSFAFGGAGGCGPALPYQYRILNGGLPPGLTLSSSGTVTGQPSQSGTYSFWVELSDENPPSQNWCFPTTAQREFTITIDPGLQLLTNSLPQNATVGAPYSTTLQAMLVTSLNPPTGSTPASLTWSIAPGVGNGMPPGLTLGNGVISGTPTAEGTYTFRVVATLEASSSFQTYSLTVRQPLKVAAASGSLATSPALTLGEVGVPFAATLAGSGGTGTYTWSLASGTLPTGVALAADGTVAGKPTAAGLSHATIRLTDSEGRTADYPASFAVAQRLAISTFVLKHAKVSRPYRARVATTGGVLPKLWRITSGSLPHGIHFDRALGVLSGTPTKPGRYRLTFEATDGLKVKATKTLAIAVLA